MPNDRTATDARYRVQSVDRALDVLDALAAAGADGLSLTEIARSLGTSKSTAFALLRTLAQRDYVVQLDPRAGRRYRLGLALARLGDQVLSQLTLVDVALPGLRALSRETGRTSRLGILDDGYAVIVGRVDAPGPVRFQSHLGRRELPHSSAIGKSLLACLPVEEVRTILERVGLPGRTPKTITSVDALLDDLALVRERGFALDDEEDSEGVFCVGAPVFDHAGSGVAAISVTGLTQTLPPDGFDAIGEVVRAFAERISAGLGAAAPAA